MNGYERLSSGDQFEYMPAIWPVVQGLLGAGEVYDWVLRAQRSLGWNHAYDEEGRDTSTWAFVRRNFPERWLLFLQETLGGELGEMSRFSPNVLASYFIFMGRNEAGQAVIEGTVRFFIQCANVLKLDAPDWAIAHA